MKDISIVCVREYLNPSDNHLVDYFTNLEKFYYWLNFHAGLIDLIDIHLFVGTFEYSHVFDGMHYEFIDDVKKFINRFMEDVSREAL